MPNFVHPPQSAMGALERTGGVGAGGAQALDRAGLALELGFALNALRSPELRSLEELARRLAERELLPLAGASGDELAPAALQRGAEALERLADELEPSDESHLAAHAELYMAAERLRQGWRTDPPATHEGGA